MSFKHLSLSLSFASCMALACPLAQAGAVLVNIDSKNAAGTTVQLDAGTYDVSWVGQAGGGLYDAWSFNTAPSNNWRNAFTYLLNGTTYTVDLVGNPFVNSATAADSLAAFGNGPFAVYSSPPTSYLPLTLEYTTAALRLTLNTASTITFSVPDNLFADNKGGVSLSLNEVPEPASLALALGALVAGGAVTRRSRAVSSNKLAA